MRPSFAAAVLSAVLLAAMLEIRCRTTSRQLPASRPTCPSGVGHRATVRTFSILGLPVLELSPSSLQSYGLSASSRSISRWRNLADWGFQEASLQSSNFCRCPLYILHTSLNACIYIYGAGGAEDLWTVHSAAG